MVDEGQLSEADLVAAGVGASPSRFGRGLALGLFVGALLTVTLIAAWIFPAVRALFGLATDLLALFVDAAWGH